MEILNRSVKQIKNREIDVSIIFYSRKTACKPCVLRALWANALSSHGSFTRLKRLLTDSKRLFMAWKEYLRLKKTMYGFEVIFAE